MYEKCLLSLYDEDKIKELAKDLGSEIKDVMLAKLGDKKAKERLFTQYNLLLRKHANKYMTKDEAEELYGILSESFLQAIIDYNINMKVPFAGFINSKIKQAAYVNKRRYCNNKEKNIHFSTLEAACENNIDNYLPASDAEVEKIYEQKYENKILFNAIQQLEPRDKYIMQEYYFAEKVDREIAEKIGCSPRYIGMRRKTILALLLKELRFKIND